MVRSMPTALLARFAPHHLPPTFLISSQPQRLSVGGTDAQACVKTRRFPDHLDLDFPSVDRVGVFYTFRACAHRARAGLVAAPAPLKGQRTRLRAARQQCELSRRRSSPTIASSLSNDLSLSAPRIWFMLDVDLFSDARTSLCRCTSSPS